MHLIVFLRPLSDFRWEPTRQIAVMFDCEGQRRADLIDGVSLDAQGALVGAQWRQLDSEDPILRIACAG